MTKDFLSTFKRFFSNRDFEKRFYMWLFLTVFIVFVFLGIIPLSQNLIKKNKAVKDLTEVNQGLEERIEDIRYYENVLTDIKPYMIYVREFIPEKFGIQDYLVDFALQSSSAGFIVQKFFPIYTEDLNVVNVSVSLRGTGDVDKLIENIENMRRVTQINTVSIYYGQEESVELSLTVYTIR